jgi:hypothetical protein
LTRFRRLLFELLVYCGLIDLDGAKDICALRWRNAHFRALALTKQFGPRKRRLPFWDLILSAHRGDCAKMVRFLSLLATLTMEDKS